MIITKKQLEEAIKVIDEIAKQDMDYFCKQIETTDPTNTDMRLIDMYEANSIKRAEKFDFVIDELKEKIKECMKVIK